jgi:plastocyanin
VKAGQPVKFVVKNQGTNIHNMHILSQATEGKDFSSDLTVNPGAESEFTATFTKTGQVKFQCDFHVPDMVGTITVQ